VHAVHAVHAGEAKKKTRERPGAVAAPSPARQATETTQDPGMECGNAAKEGPCWWGKQL
jgi:hypothetical protein